MNKEVEKILSPTLRKALDKTNWISEWHVDDGNNKLLWNDKAPTPNEVIDFLTEHCVLVSEAIGCSKCGRIERVKEAQ